MTSYIATFFSHFGAIRFKKELENLGTGVTLMPVPRAISSSCGTCAAFEAQKLPEIKHPDEIEQVVYEDENGKYVKVFSSDDI